MPEHVDLEKRIVSALDTKNHERRDVPIDNTVRDILGRLMQVRNAEPISSTARRETGSMYGRFITAFMQPSKNPGSPIFTSTILGTPSPQTL